MYRDKPQCDAPAHARNVHGPAWKLALSRRGHVIELITPPQFYVYKCVLDGGTPRRTDWGLHRILVILPIAVTYTVSEADRSVRILQVWHQ